MSGRLISVTANLTTRLTRKICQTTGHGFVVSDPSEDFDAALAMLGVDPSQLTRNAVA